MKNIKTGGFMRKTERRKVLREALQSERPWWASHQYLDAESRRRLEITDRRKHENSKVE